MSGLTPFVDFYLLIAFCILLYISWPRIAAYRKSGPGASLIVVDPSHPTGFLWKDPQRSKIGTISERFQPYVKANKLMLSATSLVTPRSIVFVADPEVIRTIANDRSGTFEKDPQTYSVLHVYGHNIVGSDGPAWKKIRYAARAAFSESNVILVWKESCRLSRQAVEQLVIPSTLGPIDVPDFLRRLTLPITSASAFGQQIPYGKEPSAPLPAGHKLQFGEALKTACQHMVTRWAAPEWAYKIPVPALRRLLSHVRLSFQELEAHLRRMITEFRTILFEDLHNGVKRDSQDDLLRRLVEANTLEKDPSKRLTDQELVSNVFIFLVAGHETTAHAMSFVLAHLALYPEVQAKVFEEICSVWPDERDVQLAPESFQDFAKFEYLLAVFRESLRLFPAAPRLPKNVTQDTVLHSHARFATGPGNEGTSIAISKGSCVVMDIMATHCDPAYWGEDATEFRPERFIDTPNYQWPREAYLAFSTGVRSCIGQRAGQVQSLCILAHLLRSYEVSLPPQLEGLPFETQRSTLLRFWLGSSLTPKDIKLTFTRRETKF